VYEHGPPLKAAQVSRGKRRWAEVYSPGPRPSLHLSASRTRTAALEPPAARDGARNPQEGIRPSTHQRHRTVFSLSQTSALPTTIQAVALHLTAHKKPT